MNTEYFMKWSELDVVMKILVAMMVVAIVGLSVFFSGYWMTGLIVVWFAMLCKYYYCYSCGNKVVIWGGRRRMEAN